MEEVPRGVGRVRAPMPSGSTPPGTSQLTSPRLTPSFRVYGGSVHAGEAIGPWWSAQSQPLWVAGGQRWGCKSQPSAHAWSLGAPRPHLIGAQEPLTPRAPGLRSGRQNGTKTGNVFYPTVTSRRTSRRVCDGRVHAH